MGGASFSSEIVKAKIFVGLLFISFGLYGCQGCLEEERIALLQLRDSLNYPNGSALVDKWVGDDCCGWEFLNCNLFNSTYRVVSIAILLLRNVSGVEKWYPNASLFTHFTELQSLYLHGNDIGGWIMPEALCELQNLKELSLLGNSLDDASLPKCLTSSLPLLEVFSLRGNSISLSPPLFSGLCKLRKLRSLDLSMNLIGNIPWPCLSELNSLQSLDLSQNQISGTIPHSISNLTSLIKLDLSSNKFDGVVFFSLFANLSKLEKINLSNNKELEVETEFPTYWVPSFQLKSLNLGNCKLNKRARRNIPHFISTQFSLFYLSLSYTSLQGTIPSWLFYNASPYLYSLILSGNYLHGPFPLPSNNETSSIRYLDISDNSIEGQLPTNIDGLFPNSFFFNMSKNKLGGSIPPSFGNLDLTMLELSNNYFVGEVPHILTQNSTSLTHLFLSNNHLHAMARVSNMTSLRFLTLDGNLFSRPFPITPSSVPSLQLLDISRNSISGNIQDWLPIFPKLVSLLVRENHFFGFLPTSLCQMQQLSFLDLSNNHLSGNIPSCFNNITSWLEETDKASMFEGAWVLNDELISFKLNFATKGNMYSYKGVPLHLMTGIDLSLNQFSGDIPSQMGELRALHSLNLSYNSLVGYLPESFQGLEKLESLDLSHNKLVGMIPAQMIQLYSLSVFTVAFNQLSGKIPYEKNFATFSKNSYIGNPGLCGPPTEVNCSSPQPPHDEYKEGDVDEQSLIDNDLFFYSYVAISYMLGFWIVVAPLLLSRNWRRKYYRVVDGCIEWCSDRFFWFLFYIKNRW
ncbi:receptor-like protein 56 [Macadamia integrifolia]|uniref:receptor-like protein 56 n=1 Tax=Macadamia integrifolia TaxID=60698 RepID=UPI001C4FF7B2|nr:receptor-like protein 56 [Macadamia integrifolia]